MHNDYSDITSRIEEVPSWYDDNGVPRYGEFHPEALPDIYINEAILYKIACQNCGTQFLVAEGVSRFGDIIGRMYEYETDNDPEKGNFGEWASNRIPQYPLAEAIKNSGIHYGDPPNSGCCPSGPTMNCDDLRILQYWRRDKTTNYEWKRFHEFEILLSDHPDYGDEE